MRQIQAQQTCDKESGFCCSDGEISQASRGVCKEKKGQFSLNRATLSRTCSPVKKPAAVKPQAKPVIPEKVFNEPIFKQKTSSSKEKTVRSGKAPSEFDSPVFVPPANKKSDAGRSVQQGGAKVRQPVHKPKGAPIAGTGLVTAGAAAVSKSTRDSTAPPISHLEFDPSVVDIIVRTYNFQTLDGTATDKLLLKSLSATITCGSAELQSASLVVGNNYFTVNELEKVVDDNGVMVVHNYPIATHAEFTQDYHAESYIQQATFPFVIKKTCVEASGPKSYENSFGLSVRYSSDPASYGVTSPGMVVSQGLQNQIVSPPDGVVSQGMSLSNTQGEVQSVVQQTEVQMEQPSARVKMKLPPNRIYSFQNGKLSWRDPRKNTWDPGGQGNIDDYIEVYTFTAHILCKGYSILKDADIHVVGTTSKAIYDLQDRDDTGGSKNGAYYFEFQEPPDNIFMTVNEIGTQFCPPGHDSAKTISLNTVLEYSCEHPVTGAVASGSVDYSEKIVFEFCRNTN